MTLTLYLVGPPGVGKTTALDHLVSRLGLDQGEAERVGLMAAEPLILDGWPVGVRLGRTRERFSGTDALGMAVHPQAVEWAKTADLPGLILGEGARLTTVEFLSALAARTRLLIGWMQASPQALDARCDQRGSDQKPAFRKGAATRARNAALQLAAQGAEVTALDTTSLDPAEAAAALLDLLRGTTTL